MEARPLSPNPGTTVVVRTSVDNGTTNFPGAISGGITVEFEHPHLDPACLSHRRPRRYRRRGLARHRVHGEQLSRREVVLPVCDWLQLGPEQCDVRPVSSSLHVGLEQCGVPVHQPEDDRGGMWHIAVRRKRARWMWRHDRLPGELLERRGLRPSLRRCLLHPTRSGEEFAEPVPTHLPRMPARIQLRGRRRRGLRCLRV